MRWLRLLSSLHHPLTLNVEAGSDKTAHLAIFVVDQIQASQISVIAVLARLMLNRMAFFFVQDAGLFRQLLITCAQLFNFTLNQAVTLP